MASPVPRPADRVAAIDMVKGLAILGVTLIHARAWTGSLPMSLVFAHSVEIFVVLFGLNSELWFRRHAGPGRTRSWYVRATKRVLIPVYAAVVAWWVLVALLRPPVEFAEISADLPLRHAVGWLSQIGTGWFVTLLIQLVLLFPALHWLARRIGVYPLFALSFVVTMPTLMFHHALRAELGVGTWLFFSPRFFAHVAFGMVLAGRGGRIRRRGLAMALAFLVPLYAWQLRLWWPEMRVFGNRFVELPLTVVLLWIMARLDGVSLLERSLSWLGRHSLGLYLGQMLAHNAFVYRFGGSCTLYGCVGGVYEKFPGWLYAILLFAGSLFFLGLGHAALRAYDEARARGAPLPDLRL